MIVALSSHLDDLIFSAGQFLAAQNDVKSLTLFAGTPENKAILTAYDAKYNFPNADVAMRTRRNEDIEAHVYIGIVPDHMEFTDTQYTEPRDRARIRDLIQIYIEQHKPDLLLAPLGVGHPDHRLTSELAIELSDHLSIPIRLYEDAPCKIIDPDRIYERKQELKELGYTLDYDAYPNTPLTPKLQAIMCYRSQLGGDLNPVILSCPERFWNVTRG